MQLQLHLQLQLQLLRDTITRVTTIKTITTSTTLQLRLQLQLQLLRYATLHPGVVSEVTAATTATTPKSTTPTTFWFISGFALQSVSHNNQPFLEVFYF